MLSKYPHRLATAYALGLFSTAGPQVLRVLLLWARRQIDSETAAGRVRKAPFYNIVADQRGANLVPEPRSDQLG